MELNCERPTTARRRVKRLVLNAPFPRATARRRVKRLVSNAPLPMCGGGDDDDDDDDDDEILLQARKGSKRRNALSYTPNLPERFTLTLR